MTSEIFGLYAADKIDALRAENERLAEELQNQAIVATRDGVAAITWYGKYKVLHAENERLRKVLRMSRPYLLYADTAHEPPKELIAEIDEALKGGDE